MKGYVQFNEKDRAVFWYDETLPGVNPGSSSASRYARAGRTPINSWEEGATLVEERTGRRPTRRGYSIEPTPVDPVLAYVRGMRRDDTQNPGPTGSAVRRESVVNFQQADAMPSGLMRGEFKRAGLPGGEYLEALIKEYAARFDGQEALAVTMEGESPFLDALAAALDIEVIHV